MRVFIAGATGAIGSRLTPELVRAGHQVIGTTRTEAKLDMVSQYGAIAVLMDGLDPGSVRRAVTGAAPDVVVHQMTDLGGDLDLRHFARSFAVTNRLRVEGTDSLLSAAREVGAKRIVLQSYTGWPNEMSGDPIKSEEDPINPHPDEETRETIEAIRHVERATLDAKGIDALALRYGGFYGPGNALGRGGAMLEAIANRRMPLVGDGAGISSFIHVDDAATATALAVERGAPGLYNIVDDEPAPASEWLPYLAGVIGAKPPRKVPVWLARLLAGEPSVSMMTRTRGSSNAKAKRELDWTLKFPSWREGFKRGL